MGTFQIKKKKLKNVPKGFDAIVRWLFRCMDVEGYRNSVNLRLHVVHDKSSVRWDVCGCWARKASEREPKGDLMGLKGGDRRWWRQTDQITTIDRSKAAAKLR